MTAFRIIEAEGKWVTNPHAFAFADPETGVRYEPGAVLKVGCPEGSWLAGQIASKVLALAPDPTAPPPSPAKAPTGAKAKSAGG